MYVFNGRWETKVCKCVRSLCFLHRVFVGCLEVQERTVGMVIQAPLVLKAFLGLVVVMETEEQEELRVTKVLQGKLVPRACLGTQAPMGLL